MTALPRSFMDWTFLDWLILASFISLLIPSLILFVLYGLRTRWQGSAAGRALFGLVLVVVVTTALSVVTLLFPDPLKDSAGQTIRIVSRFVVSLVMWNLLRLFLKAQREAGDEPKSPIVPVPRHSEDPGAHPESSSQIQD